MQVTDNLTTEKMNKRPATRGANMISRRQGFKHKDPNCRTVDPNCPKPEHRTTDSRSLLFEQGLQRRVILCMWECNRMLIVCEASQGG